MVKYTARVHIRCHIFNFMRRPLPPSLTYRVAQLYIYSPLDQVCDVNKLEQLIAIRRQRISQVCFCVFLLG